MIDINYQISTATQEQSAVNQDVNRSVNNIGSISKATLKGAMETEKAREDVARLSDYLQRLVGKFTV